MWNVTPIFAKPLLNTYVDLGICDDLKKVCAQMKWNEDTWETGYKSGASKDTHVLHTMDRSVLKYFEDLFNECVRSYLGYQNFIQITTSWFTKTYPGGFAAEHVHTNSWYSAVLYFDEYNDDSSKLKLVETPSPILPLYDEYNIFNAGAYMVPPQKGLMVMFPSEVRHLVTPNNSDQTRYSIAFNMMPKGPCGSGDSAHHY
jgi:uncharacterized protein (TIGR02466 family)|tara:strand:- start:496 stop:1098 length:603 start_codon:yes stop_codon:yes gene_type:complete